MQTEEAGSGCQIPEKTKNAEKAQKSNYFQEKRIDKSAVHTI